jgi:pilus assembly protein Flp/PilA
MFKNLLSMLTNEDGATLVEYALIVALISVACIIAINKLSTQVQSTLNSAANKMGAG